MKSILISSAKYAILAIALSVTLTVVHAQTENESVWIDHSWGGAWSPTCELDCSEKVREMVNMRWKNQSIPPKPPNPSDEEINRFKDSCYDQCAEMYKQCAKGIAGCSQQPEKNKEPEFTVDCNIPQKYQNIITLAWKDALTKYSDTSCRNAFNKVALFHKFDPKRVSEKLNGMKISLADGCKPLQKRLQDILGSREISEAGYSQTGGDTVWIAYSRIQAGQSAITCTILHESAHLAGAPGDQLAEFGLDIIHRDCNCPRGY